MLISSPVSEIVDKYHAKEDVTAIFLEGDELKVTFTVSGGSALGNLVFRFQKDGYKINFGLAKRFMTLAMTKVCKRPSILCIEKLPGVLCEMTSLRFQDGSSVNVILRIEDVNVWDNGVFTCHVSRLMFFVALIRIFVTISG